MVKEKPYRVGILGIRGRLGALCAQQAKEDSNFEFIGGSSREADPTLKIFNSASHLAEKCDVLIDVSHHSLLKEHAEACKKANCAWVVGVTGYDKQELGYIEDASQSIPILTASNFSPGLAVFLNLASLATKELEGFDVHVDETHHRNKKDAPSGTALSIANAVKSTKDIPVSFSSTRGGAVIGEHSLRFIGDREEITISHRAFDRGLFASGALLAAKWLVDKKRENSELTGLFLMKDVVASQDKKG